MAIRGLSATFWRDPRVRGLPAEPRVVLLGLLLGPERTSLPGLVPIGAAGLSDSLGPGMPRTVVEKALDYLKTSGLVLLDQWAPLIWIPEGTAWDIPPTPNVVRSWRRVVPELPPSPLIEAAAPGLLELASAHVDPETTGSLREALERAIDQSLRVLGRASEGPPVQARARAATATTKATTKATATDPWGLAPPGQDPDKTTASSPPAAPPAKAGKGDQVREVFDHWQQTLGHGRSKLDAKRKARIQARLRENFSVDELKAAIDGVKLSAWHMGDNPDGRIYDGIDTVLRDAAQVEKFRDLSEGKSQPASRKAGEVQRGYREPTASGEVVPCPPELRAKFSNALRVIPGGGGDGS